MPTSKPKGQKRGTEARRKELKMLARHEGGNCPMCDSNNVEYVTMRSPREEIYCCSSCDSSWRVTFQAVGLEVEENGRYEALVAAGGKE